MTEQIAEEIDVSQRSFLDDDGRIVSRSGREPYAIKGSDVEDHEQELAAAVTPLRSEMLLGPGLERQARSRRKMLLVLDLNGLLLDSFDRGDERPVGAMVKVGRKWIYKRPGVAEFLRLCISRFDVGVWSCAREENVWNYVATVFPEELQEKLLFVWGQDQCTDTGQKVPGNNKPGKMVKPLFLKELAVLWEAFPEYGMTNTIMVDDTPYKSLRNPTFTAIFPKPYSAFEHDLDDGALLREVWPWLEQLSVSNETVQSYVIRNPLGEPAISPGHPDWELYSEVVYAKTFKRHAKQPSGTSVDPLQIPVRVEAPVPRVEPPVPRRRTSSSPFPVPIGWPELEARPSVEEPRFVHVIQPGFQPQLQPQLLVQVQHDVPMHMMFQQAMQPAGWLGQPQQQSLQWVREREQSRSWVVQMEEVAQMAQQYFQQVPLQGVGYQYYRGVDPQDYQGASLLGQPVWNYGGPLLPLPNSQQLPLAYGTAHGDNLRLPGSEGHTRRSRRESRNRHHPYG